MILEIRRRQRTARRSAQSKQRADAADQDGWHYHLLLHLFVPLMPAREDCSCPDVDVRLNVDAPSTRRYLEGLVAAVRDYAQAKQSRPATGDNVERKADVLALSRRVLAGWRPARCLLLGLLRRLAG